MKKLFSILTICILLVGCSTDSNITEKVDESLIETRNNNVNEIAYNTIFTNAFPNVQFNEFWDETHDGTTYKYALGSDLEGNSVSARIDDVKKESCTGVGCSKCKILPAGGCSCEKKETTNVYCNHKIEEDRF